jgi:hypothetical protein
MLQALEQAGVRFVIVGGVAARIHGSPRVTEDLDVCYATDAENCARLASLLQQWKARLRGADEGLPFVVDAEALRAIPMLTLRTDQGDLDLMHDVLGIGDYQACQARSEWVRFQNGSFAVLSLPALIEAKRATGRRKDQEHLPELEALHALRQDRPSPDELDLDPSGPDTQEALADDLRMYRQLVGLRIERLKVRNQPERLAEIDEQLRQLPAREVLEARIRRGMRDPAQVAALTSEELEIARGIRATR